MQLFALHESNTEKHAEIWLISKFVFHPALVAWYSIILTGSIFALEFDYNRLKSEFIAEWGSFQQSCLIFDSELSVRVSLRIYVFSFQEFCESNMIKIKQHSSVKFAYKNINLDRHVTTMLLRCMVWVNFVFNFMLMS